MRIFFCALQLAVIAAMILIQTHRAYASSVCVVQSNESTQFNETVQGFKKHLAQHGFSSEIKIHSLSRDGQQPKDIALSVNQTKATTAGPGKPGRAGRIAGKLGNPGDRRIGIFSGGHCRRAECNGRLFGHRHGRPAFADKAAFSEGEKSPGVYSMENEKKIAEASKISQKYGLGSKPKKPLRRKTYPMRSNWSGKMQTCSGG